MSFQLWTTDNPTYLKEILPFFQTPTGLTNEELVEATGRIGLSDSVKRIAHMTQFWYILGILDRELEPTRAYRYKLSKFGEDILNSLQFGSSMPFELVHWSMYSAWLRTSDFEWGWSWLYKEACDEMWEHSPDQVVTKKLQSALLERANMRFPELAPTFDVQAVRSVTYWLSALDPPFLVKEDESKKGSPWLSQRRRRCSPELLFLSIQLQYHTKGLSFGTPLLMNDDLVDALCKVCMLDPDEFWPMAEVSSLTFPYLVRKETAYGTALTIAEVAPFTPPEPRATGTRRRRGDR